VLCDRCQQELLESTRRAREGPCNDVATSDTPDLTDLKARYRDVLESVDSFEDMRAKLSQLSRFGLGEGDQPLFTSTRRPSGRRDSGEGTWP
jgi:hypothetical protein